MSIAQSLETVSITIFDTATNVFFTKLTPIKPVILSPEAVDEVMMTMPQGYICYRCGHLYIPFHVGCVCVWIVGKVHQCTVRTVVLSMEVKTWWL